jgi:hypothetical protein
MSDLEREYLATVALTNPGPPNARDSEQSEESLFHVLGERQRDSSMRGLRSECRFQLNLANH